MKPKKHPIGATTKETITIIVLVTVILVSATYSLFTLFKSSPRGADVIELHYTCSLCEKQYTTLNTETGETPIDHEVLDKHPDRSLDMTNCPHCQEKHTGLLMTECPKCNEHFLLAKVNLRNAPEGFVAPPPVCPHCNTNIRDYVRENLKAD